MLNFNSNFIGSSSFFKESTNTIKVNKNKIELILTQMISMKTKNLSIKVLP